MADKKDKERTDILWKYKNHNLKVGDTFEYNGGQYEITAMSQGTNGLIIKSKLSDKKR